jgi:hypothetical protein
LLLLAKNFAQAAFSAIALDGVADCGSRGDHSDARPDSGRAFFGVLRQRGHRSFEGLSERTPIKPKDKAAAIEAAAFFPRIAEIMLPPHMLLGAETHDAMKKRVSNNGQALTALAAPSGEDFAAAFGGLAGAVADLAGALLTVWAECRLHM